MSNTKHTPGRWKTDTEYYDGKQFAVHGPNGCLIATVAHHVKTVGEDDEAIEKAWKFSAKEKANAKLIAAAPELKRLLIGILKTGYHDTVLGSEAISLLQSIGEEL